jgi:hypothetical protein
VNMTCGMWGSGEGGGSGGVDTSFEHADQHAAQRNVAPHTGIEPRHVESARWIRQGGTKQSPYRSWPRDVGLPWIYAYNINLPLRCERFEDTTAACIEKKRMSLGQVSGTRPP